MKKTTRQNTFRAFLLLLVTNQFRIETGIMGSQKLEVIGTGTGMSHPIQKTSSKSM